MRGFLQHLSVVNQEDCPIGRGNNPGEDILEVLEPRPDGEIIFNLLASGVYPIRKQF